MSDSWHLVIDLAIVVLLIVGIGQFRTPRRARWGNLTAAFALACALVVVLYRNPVLSPALVLTAFMAGSLVGWAVAMRADMIQIPAMVAFQHGAGGLAVVLVSYVELTRDAASSTPVAAASGILALAVGAATFSASMIASGKLARVLRQSTTVFPHHDGILIAMIVAVVALALAAGTLTGSAAVVALLGTLVVSILIGIVFSIRVGGADMPVLISFLNATSGLAAALCGIVIQNRLLIACGATVAASGSILTHAMCRAMNRRLGNVFVGISAAPVAAPRSRSGNDPAEGHTVATTAPAERESPEISAEDAFARAARVARDAATVIIIPGYGMALRRRQFETVQLANRLLELGKIVRFVVHPIAGRMPGHMHVLLAEAEVDPDTLFEMDEINSEFSATDLAIVVGACDVVNPAATSAENTPISGMPVLAAGDAGHVMVCNLDDRPGYSGVENPLYTNPNTIMILGDAKDSMRRLREALE